MSLFEELKRRNVVRVGVAYAVIGWILAQVAEFAFENFGAPDWVLKTVVVVILLGLPLALFFAWAFEITPDGVKREDEVDRSQSTTHSTGRKLDFVIIGLLVIALGYFVWERQLEPGDTATNIQTNAQETPTAATLPVEVRSIAVLPFANMTADEEQNWIADGLTEEILNALTRIPDLLVTSRTSSFAYKDSQLDIPAIAAALGVNHILEGSVRRGNDRLRITAQLIRANDGFHLWSENYDRTPEDIILIQEDVATQIARAMDTALDPDALAAMVSAGTGSVPAFEAYLAGQAQLNAAFDTGDQYLSLDARDALEEAVRLDAEFARAYLLLSQFWHLQYDLTNITTGLTDHTHEERGALRDEALAMAIKYERDEPMRLMYLSIKDERDLNYRRALSRIADYTALRPNDERGHLRQLSFYRRLGMHDESLALLLEREQAFYRTAGSAAMALQTIRFTGDQENIRRFVTRAVAEYGDYASVVYQAHRALLWTGDIDGASRLVPVILRSDMPEDNHVLVELRQACAERRNDDADRAYRSILEKYPGETGAIWVSHKMMGEDEAAREMLVPFDENEEFPLLIEFLGYSFFDPDEMPNFSAALAGNNIENRVVQDIPYRCNR